MKSYYQLLMSLRGAAGRVGRVFFETISRPRRRSNLLFSWGLLRRSLHSLLAMTILSSCTALDVLNATPIAIPSTETPLPTATIVWFPPSATPTLEVFATNPPTPEMRPGLSTTFLTDDFSDPSLWDIAASDQASADIESNRLTLAAQSEVYMSSLRHELFIDDYYAEITARPSLCRGEDSYGLHIRANGGIYYRFGLACDGTAHMDRLTNGTKLTLQKPLASGDVPPGAPGEVRIGIWAVGAEMRLFLNGRFQFSVRDPSSPIGTIGVFVNSSGKTATIVSFSDLVIKEVEYIPPTSTPLP